eukprot:CAMPEP_0168602246 /NCGR_PEP_ID=MMETSP0420-20121227/13950_1 /TAXON_ID=498008 /ORGANISM="Pessonella sp." /LENGTH=346 /DNA_ID=CAMNT_0008640861 /DNA_START=53 /DNA_END=1090 /DNA_ORIENTATION=+
MPSLGDTKSDFNSLKTKVKPDQACYFLFRSAPSSSKWWLISWIPDNSPAKDKMIYAATKATLKKALGAESFVDDLNFTTRDEFDYESFKTSRESNDTGLSKREKAIKELNAAEAEARREFANNSSNRQPSNNNNNINNNNNSSSSNNNNSVSGGASIADRSAAFRQGGGNSGSGRAVASQAARVGVKRASSGIGGYHGVKIPLNAEAKAAFDSLSNGQIKFVCLKINDEANAIQVDKQEANCDAAAFAAALVESEPRFYVFKRAMGGVVFVMGVPDKSAPKLRMVYSTAKANVSDALAAAGVTLSKKLEWDSADFKEFAAAPVACHTGCFQSENQSSSSDLFADEW